MSRDLILIPARSDSSRYPNKLHTTFLGRTLLELTYKRALNYWMTHDVAVVAGDPKIVALCEKINAPYVFTNDATHIENGTQRAAWAFDTLQHYFEPKRVIVWQADEPCLPLDLPFQKWSETGITTLVAPIDVVEVADENQVKAHVHQATGRVHWFSRYTRSRLGHVGLYCFPALFFYKCCALPMTDNAKEESLEQITWLENGYTIESVCLAENPVSINVERDWERYASATT
jgi:3-deoxy-manno-octulosonate cytidylyltransferase (CMP-KDO synthetase)